MNPRQFSVSVIFFMFLEPDNSLEKVKQTKGWMEVITGCMFSGKSEELIRRLNRTRIARQKVEIFKPKIDTRYHEEDIVTHSKMSIRSTAVSFAHDMLLLAGDCEVVGIDEAQFFDEEILEVVTTLTNSGKRVIIAGLDMDFEAKPFGYMPQLMAMAEYVTKTHAVCVRCGANASYSYRLTKAKKAGCPGRVRYLRSQVP